MIQKYEYCCIQKQVFFGLFFTVDIYRRAVAIKRPQQRNYCSCFRRNHIFAAVADHPWFHSFLLMNLFITIVLLNCIFLGWRQLYSLKRCEHAFQAYRPIEDEINFQIQTIYYTDYTFVLCLCLCLNLQLNVKTVFCGDLMISVIL